MSQYEAMVDDIMQKYADQAAAFRPHSPMTVDPTYLLMIIGRARQAVPHEHSWKVTGGRYVGSGQGENAKLELWCSCGELRYVENRLPVEVPD